MKISKLKKAMKNSNDFLTLGIHGYYAINEDDKLVFYKKGITNNIFTTYIKYTEITRLIIE